MDQLCTPKILSKRRRSSVKYDRQQIEGIGEEDGGLKASHLLNGLDGIEDKKRLQLEPVSGCNPQHRSLPRPKTSGWLKRCLNSTFHCHRRLGPMPSSCRESLFQQESPVSSIPGSSIDPPKISEDLFSGAAARPAAATQNEVLESLRTLKLSKSESVKDFESGIGIEMRDQEVNGDASIIRIGECFWCGIKPC